MHSDLTEVLPGMGFDAKLKGSEDVKNSLFQDEDPLLGEKATLPTGVFAVHVFGAQNLYLDANFPPEHFGIYVQITVGSITKCSSLQSPVKKGCIVWDDVKNFPATIYPKATNPFNKVVIAVIGYDKLQPIPKHKLLGKTEFHLHKLAKKQWSMETFELHNRKKQYAGDIQLELAFAYGSYGYGLCDQLESHQPPRYYLKQSAFPHLELSSLSSGSSSGVVFAPKRVSHPNIIPFKEKITNLEPQISPYFTLKMHFTPVDTKSRPHLQPKLTRLSQLYSEYSQFTTRTKRIHYLKRLLQEKDIHGSLPLEQESDSDDSSLQDLGEVTQFGLTNALSQMANLTFMAAAPELIQEGEKQVARRVSALSASGSSKGETDAVFRGLPTNILTAGDPSHLEASFADVEDDQETGDEAEIVAMTMSRGRRTAVVLPNSRKRSINTAKKRDLS
ncbi:cation channel sperm-associated targeting subunit tau-like isoform X2 [Montipora capricornis]|uniref:cation channel sperm-associated targeting subunit tau-like isoform X2 n=1 Tax=Montipora capricornis TaxID=246305 RepID=UPI0035F1576B